MSLKASSLMVLIHFKFIVMVYRARMIKTDENVVVQFI